jgi:hypothetical protein
LVHIGCPKTAREKQNGSRSNDFKGDPLTDSKDSICSRTDTEDVRPL